jgi:hypothetical protein
MDLLV